MILLKCEKMHAKFVCTFFGKKNIECKNKKSLNFFSTPLHQFCSINFNERNCWNKNLKISFFSQSPKIRNLAKYKKFIQQ